MSHAKLGTSTLKNRTGQASLCSGGAPLGTLQSTPVTNAARNPPHEARLFACACHLSWNARTSHRTLDANQLLIVSPSFVAWHVHASIALVEARREGPPLSLRKAASASGVMPPVGISFAPPEPASGDKPEGFVDLDAIFGECLDNSLDLHGAQGGAAVRAAIAARSVDSGNFGAGPDGSDGSDGSDDDDDLDDGLDFPGGSKKKRKVPEEKMGEMRR